MSVITDSVQQHGHSSVPQQSFFRASQHGSGSYWCTLPRKTNLNLVSHGEQQMQSARVAGDYSSSISPPPSPSSLHFGAALQNVHPLSQMLVSADVDPSEAQQATELHQQLAEDVRLRRDQ